MKRFILIALCTLSQGGAADEPRREMWEEPGHQLVFERDGIRILDIRMVPGVTSEFHSHHFATVYIRIQDALMQNQEYGEEWGDKVERPYGPVGSLMNRSDYVDNNSYHRVHNFDDRTFHLLSIVNAANHAPDTESISAAEESGLLSNAWFAEHRVALGPGETSEVLTFENDAVLVQVDSDGQTYILEEGVTHSAKSESGAWSWHAGGSNFQVVNGSEESRQLVVVEVRK